MEAMLIFIVFLIIFAIVAGLQWGKRTVRNDVTKQYDWQIEKLKLKFLRG